MARSVTGSHVWVPEIGDSFQILVAIDDSGQFNKCGVFPDEPRRALSLTSYGVSSASGAAGSRDRRRHAEAEAAPGAGGAGRRGRGRDGRTMVTRSGSVAGDARAL